LCPKSSRNGKGSHLVKSSNFTTLTLQRSTSPTINLNLQNVRSHQVQARRRRKSLKAKALARIVAKLVQVKLLLRKAA
jgi:hypothetical protein